MAPSKSISFLISAALFAGVTPSQAPQFRATVDLATVDFRAMSGGRPVTDLRQDEVLLKVDGRARASQQLAFVGAEDVAPSNPSATRLPPPFWTNRTRDAGRAFFLYFDDQNIGPGNERPSRDAALRFLDGLGVYDRISVITSAGTQVALTTDHARARAAVSAVTSNSRTPISQGGPVLAGLDTFLGSLAPLDGPKNVVLISEGLRANPNNNVPLTALELRDLARTAFRARAQMYLIRPLSLGGTEADSDVNFEWLADAVGAAGGDVFQPGGQVDAVFARIERESAGSYVLGFSPSNDDTDGKLHRVARTSEGPALVSA
jgi:VWFA-related protein